MFFIRIISWKGVTLFNGGFVFQMGGFIFKGGGGGVAPNGRASVLVGGFRKKL